MNSRKYAVIAGAFTVALGVCQAQQADARDVTTLLRNFLGVDSYVLGRSSRFVPNQSTVQNNVNIGIANLAAQISQGQASGQLSPVEAASLESKLDELVDMRDSFMADGGYTGAEVQAMLTAFNDMNSMISTALGNPNVATTIFSPRYYLPDHDAVLDLQASVRARLDRAIANRTISRFQAMQFRQELDQISRQIHWRAMRGDLNTNPMVRRLTNLDRRLTNAIATRRYYRWY